MPRIYASRHGMVNLRPGGRVPMLFGPRRPLTLRIHSPGCLGGGGDPSNSGVGDAVGRGEIAAEIVVARFVGRCAPCHLDDRGNRSRARELVGEPAETIVRLSLAAGAEG